MSFALMYSMTIVLLCLFTLSWRLFPHYGSPFKHTCTVDRSMGNSVYAMG
jgi:hypothetical protein